MIKLHERTKELRNQQGSNATASQRHDLVIIFRAIGSALMRSSPDEALVSAEEARDTMKGLIDSDPANLDWRSELSIIHEFIGDLFKVQGHFEQALAAYDESLAIRKDLTQRDSNDPTRKKNRADTDEKIGDAFAASGDLDRAHASYGDGLEIREDLVRRIPKNAAFQRALVATQRRIGDALRDHGRIEDALAAYHGALGRAKDLLPASALRASGITPIRGVPSPARSIICTAVAASISTTPTVT
jgi:tetratricopeptide (TPR) repeat protein